MKKVSVFLSIVFAATILVTSCSGLFISQSPPGAKVYFITPTDGQTISQTSTVVMGLSGMGVAPAGVRKENTGHHHVLIDFDELPDLSKPLSTKDDAILHLGEGQTETELTLSPGEHTLQLVLANFAHIPHDEPVLSEQITVIVE